MCKLDDCSRYPPKHVPIHPPHATGRVSDRAYNTVVFGYSFRGKTLTTRETNVYP
ncbi:hypothetical protein HFTV1-gp15 [Haloferax tailed virus 1]|uniref:Uncharacterized protein n=1 Tax=Haloferax tailed virus 1 TaxID=2507575 RepID=A0A410N6R9_HFTV1|nr:hypothetical protein M1M17_gp15 [Haloferax tailed virus 1]QAS68848.1 hypothetical protein HFTV1-gp15 [Haloferax tailed virus 1]